MVTLFKKIVWSLGLLFLSPAVMASNSQEYYDLSSTSQLVWPSELKLRVRPLADWGGILLTGKKDGVDFTAVVLRKRAQEKADKNLVEREWSEILEVTKMRRSVNNLGCKNDSQVFQCSHVGKMFTSQNGPEFEYENVFWNQASDRVVIQVKGTKSEEWVKNLGTQFSVRAVSAEKGAKQ